MQCIIEYILELLVFKEFGKGQGFAGRFIDCTFCCLYIVFLNKENKMTIQIKQFKHIHDFSAGLICGPFKSYSVVYCTDYPISKPWQGRKQRANSLASLYFRTSNTSSKVALMKH